MLVCNADPPLRPLRLEPAHSDRIVEHVARSLDLVAVPLAAFLGPISERSGRVVVVSSAAVTTPTAQFPHHVTAKQAVEGLVHAASVAVPGAAYLVVRPPPMATDRLNTPWGRLARPTPPGVVAAAVLQWMASPAGPGTMQIIEQFDREQ